MPTPVDDPLRKVTLNLYEADCQALEAYYGRGWTTHVRLLINTHAQYLRPKSTKRTLGDFPDDTGSYGTED